MTNPSPEQLAPAILQPETTATPETREAVMYDPKRILGNLEARMRNAVNQEDKNAIQDIVDKLSASLSSKTAQTREGARGVLASLKEQLPVSGRKMLEEAQGIVPTSVEKGLETGGKVAKETAVQAREMGSKAIDAIKSGNMDEAKKLAEGVKETMNAAGEKVREFSGSAAIDKIFAPLREKGIFGIFAVLGNLMKFISGGFTWTEVMEGAAGAGVVKQGKDALKTAGDVAKTAESAAEDVTQLFANAQETFQEFKKIDVTKNPDAYHQALLKFKASFESLSKIQEKLSPEQQEWLKQAKASLPWNPDILLDKKEKDKWIETQIGPVAKKISDEFYAGGELSADQIGLIRKGLQDMQFGQNTIEMIRARVKNPNDPTAASFSDASDLLTELLLGNAQMLGIMFRIVPFHRFAWNVTKTTVSEGADIYHYNLSLVFHRIKGVNPPEMTFKSDTLAANISKMKNDPVAQDMLLMQMYRVNGLFASIAGAAVGGAMSALYMAVNNSHGADGFRDFKNVINKNYGSLATEMEKIEKAFGPGNDKFKPKLAEMIRTELEVMRKNWLVLSLAQEGQNDAGKIAALLKTSAYQGLDIKEADLLKNSHNVRGFLATKMSAEGANAGALARLPGRVFGTAAGAGGDFLDHLQDAKKFQLSLMKGDALSRLRELGGSFQILTIARHADKTLLYFKDIDSATNTLRQLGSSMGPFLKELIRSLPAVSLVIGGVDLATQDSRSLTQMEKWKNFGNVAATALVPILGPIMLLTDKNTAPRVNKDGQIENIGTGMAGLGMLTLDGVLFVNAMRAGKISNFFLERPRDVLRTLSGVVRTPTAIVHATARIANPKWLMTVEKALVKTGGRIGKVLAATIALGAAGYAYAKGPENHMEKLIEEGLWNGQTGDITEKTRSIFEKMDPKEKKGFADTLSHAVFDGDKSLPHAKSHMDDDGVYTLVAKDAEGAKAWGTALNREYAYFTEELNKLGMSVDIVNEADYNKKAMEKENADKAKAEKEKTGQKKAA